ncbi:MAG TPA: hypothetical protein VGM82_02235 [Gemmatimonadaceae bacterium]|jgi:hypothetical protein
MRRLILPLLAVLAIAACSSDHSLNLDPTDANVTGSFNLTFAAGQTLPYQAFSTTTELFDIASDKIVISADNTWVDTTNYVVFELVDGSQSTQTTVSAGTYQVATSQINFVTTTGGTAAFTGSVTGNTLSVLFNGSKFVYTR